MTVLAILCVLAAIPVATAGVLIFIPTARFAAAATASAEGTVVGYERVDAADATYFYPQVAFKAAGAEWVVEGKSGHLRESPPLGTQVVVYYPPDAPQQGELGRTGGMWAAAGLMAIGVGLAIGGVWEFLRP